jgi:hypothetical protein
MEEPNNLVHLHWPLGALRLGESSMRPGSGAAAGAAVASWGFAHRPTNPSLGAMTAPRERKPHWSNTRGEAYVVGDVCA